MKVLLIDQIAKVNYKYSFPLANGLQRAGADVHLAIDQKVESDKCICERTALFNTSEKNVGKISKLWNYIMSYRKIMRILKHDRYDIVHAEWFNFSPVDYFFLSHFKRKIGVKIVVTVHDILPFNQKVYDYYFHDKIYKLSDSIILQAPGNVKRFEEIFPNMSDKIHMIPHGHMLDYVETVDKTESREKLGLPLDKDILLFFGQIKKVKGVDYLLKAFKQIKDKHPNLFLVIAGSVWHTDFDECYKMLESDELKQAVRADIKYIPDEEVKYYYSACDICVLPYTDVYQSGVIQLAYGYRKPVIATDLEAFTQFVKEGKTGFIAQPQDTESLADAIERALLSHNDWVSIGQKGYEIVHSELNWDDLAVRIVKECY